MKKTLNVYYLFFMLLLLSSCIGTRIYGKEMIGEKDFPSAKTCAKCHPKQYEEWSTSFHAYSSMSPFAKAYGKYFYNKSSGTLGSFCIRCHDPIGTALGLDMNTPENERPAVSREGITCVVCHIIDRKYGRVNAEFPIIPGNPHKVPYSVIKSSEMCAICHAVITPDGFIFDETYPEWKNSPAAREGISCQDCHMGQVPGMNKGYETGQIADVPLKEHRGKVSDHSFVGPDYPILPITNFPLMEDEWLDESKVKEIEKKIADKIEPDSNEKQLWNTYQEMLKKAGRKLENVREKQIELLQNAAEIEIINLSKQIKNGSNLKFSVDVKSKIKGHKFPASGLAFYRQIWLEVKLIDAKGNVIFVSGDLDKNSDLRDDLSYMVRAKEVGLDKYLFNLQSKFYIRTSAGTERHVIIPINEDMDLLPYFRPASELVTAYGHPFHARLENNSIAPLAKKTANYKVRLPKSSSGEYTLIVKLQMRNFPPYLFKYLGAPQVISLLKIFTIDEKVIKIIPEG